MNRKGQFTSETAKIAGRKGGLVAAENRRAGVDRLLQFEMNGGADHMLAIREKQLRGEPLTDGEIEFKRDYKDLMEYHTPKRARVDDKGESVGDITIKIERDYGDNTTA